MRAQVHVQATATEQPEAGAKQVAEALIDRLPRQRAVTLAVLSHGPHPGLTPTPWVLDGLLAALVEGERTPVNFIVLGDAETGEALLRKASPCAGVTSTDMVERPARDRRLRLRMPPHERPISILREIVGTSLIVCAPLCCSLPAEGRPAAPGHAELRGPLASILAELAAAVGFHSSSASRRPSLLASGPAASTDADVRVAHELLGSAFASANVVLDASWLALVGASPRALGGRPRSLVPGRAAPSRPGPALEPLAELESPARVLGLADLGRTELDALLAFDAWLAHAIGLDVAAPREAPEFDAPPGRWPRPRLHLATRGASTRAPKRLADRAIAGIRRESARLRSQAGPDPLPMPTPGPLAQLWTARWYGERARASLDGGRGPAPGRRRYAVGLR